MPLQPTIQDILQNEFSPPLDTSLIAAIVADYVSGEEVNREDELRQLREVLSNLASSAEKELVDSDETPSSFPHLNVSPTSYADDTSSSFDYSTTDNSGYTSTSSGSDGTGQPFSHPLGFLRALFPQISADRLKTILASHDGRIDDLDMEALVEEVLTTEYMRELEERGLDESESKEFGYEAPWELVERKKKGVPKQKKHFKKRTTFTLVDIRQQQHARPTASGPRTPAPDPWTQLASVASHLATLIPSQSVSYFQSVFHSPNYSSPSQALRAALVQVARQVSKNFNDELTEEESPLLFSMFEILTTSQNYADLNVEARDQLLEDALFALRATGGDPNVALDIVQILVELDADLSTKEFAWGVYHQQAPQLKATAKLPSGPPNIPPPPNIKRGSQTLPSSPVSDRPRESPNVWKTIPVKPSPDGPHPFDGVIRAYSNHTPTKPARKVRGGGNGNGKGGKGDVGELQTSTNSSKVVEARRQWELQEQRRAALREAGKAWQKGNSKNRGGEIAFYFAERARELQEQVQKEQLQRAREMVMGSRSVKIHSDLIDLHGLIVVEAVAISREYLSEYFNDKPVKIITGRGNHSSNGVGVLGPAVKNALVSDGWIVDTIDGGLVVRGHSR
ncbi:hypothetical protein DICSQDRAFT_178599 [Dichomitus squalens LYAD-421 SS1]|uniref:uncharacterized protein n=1 Tax=Dichomitus squalens (strain LYAD-421) TaxID=732165 RepID=UPI0004411606|nr:uncharacterized protein DICSQDRAFT_178599 [Dichomitus squalens LYAD-421 SS1]EJF64082.1 hypothetical protein DICSQDRAFT_178599 [Dichomitus squalens LYAD-421 SS1]